VSLTPLMRDALKASARTEGLRRILRPDLEGADKWPCSPNTWRALLRRGLCEERLIRNRHGHRVQQLVITEAGRDALNPPAKDRPTDEPVLMRVKGWATTRVMQGGVWVTQSFPEPEEVDAPAGWVRDGQRRHVEALDKRVLASEVAKRVRAA
jgi:hypothetical protein